MNLTRATAFTLGAIALGFVFGLAWGRSTRASVAGSVETDVSNGILTIKADLKTAALLGLQSILD